MNNEREKKSRDATAAAAVVNLAGGRAHTRSYLLSRPCAQDYYKVFCRYKYLLRNNGTHSALEIRHGSLKKNKKNISSPTVPPPPLNRIHPFEECDSIILNDFIIVKVVRTCIIYLCGASGNGLEKAPGAHHAARLKEKGPYARACSSYKIIRHNIAYMNTNNSNNNTAI